MTETDEKKLAIQVATLERRLEDFMDVTKDYRLELCKKFDIVNLKLDTMNDKLMSLPCPERAERAKHVDNRINHLWQNMYAVWGVIGAGYAYVIKTFWEHFYK